MNIISFLSELREKNISIRLNGDDLKVSGLKKDTSSEIIEQLKQNKSELLNFLRRSGEAAWTGFPPAPVMDAYPISNAQRQLWLVDQTTDVGHAYNLFFRQEWNNVLDLDVLDQSMNFLVRRHEILRTVFVDADGDVKQKILGVEECGFRIRKMSYTGNDKETFIQSIERTEASHKFDLQQGPLLRMLVVSFGETQHMLLFTMHHIITDGWSIQVLMQELSSCYIDIGKGDAPSLPPLALQYKDFACWQHLPATQKEQSRHKLYWTSVLQGERAIVDIPADRPRPPVKTYVGSATQVKVPLQILQQINEVCQQCNCRIFSFLTAVFKTLIHRYTSENDILAGMPVSGRIYPELQNQIGYYVNMVVLRTNMQAAFSFEQLVRQIEKNMHETYEHQEYPFDKLMDDLSVRHDASRSPLFDLMINYDKKSTLLFDSAAPKAPLLAVSKFDLEADFVEYSDGLLIGFTYNKALFSMERMERLAQHFECLMLNALSDPSAPLTALDYVPQEEKLLLETFNYTDAWYPNESTVIDLFEKQVSRTPKALALEFENTAISYEHFNEHVNRVAHYLRDVHEIKPGDKIGVMLQRSERMVLAIYAVLKAGAAYVPIDPSYPLQRKIYMVQDSELKLVITDDSAAEIECCCINWNAISFENYSAENPVGANAPDHTAYMIYTSGSTGNPKGVLIQHHSLTNLCQWYTDFLYKPADRPLRTMLNGTISFDASLEILFPPLLNGSSVKIVSQAVKENTDELLSQIQESGIEVLDLIPSHMHLLLQEAHAAGITPSSVQYVITGGELLQQETCDLFFSVMPGATIVNGYGPTEACVDTTCCMLDIGTAAKPNCIGVPLPNMRVHILDKEQRESGIGIWGELFIAGVGLAAGYWKRETLTSEKFILHPQFGRIYRSGDIARWNEKGEIEFQGRADNQVKIRGFRIEMGEIESAMQSSASVQEAVAVINESGSDKKIAAVIVWSEGKEDVQGLRKYLAELLPKYMVPEQFISAERIPRNGSGKLDRRALEANDAGKQVASITAYTGVQSTTEERLLKIWQELLDTGNIDVTDNFFELGGHSLKAMRMVSRICRVFDMKISVKEIFQYATVQQLARYIDRQLNTGGYQKVEPVEKADLYPLSAGQRSLWLAVQGNEARSVYNMVSGYRWLQPLDKNVYEQSWNRLLQRHEVLRTVFVLNEGTVWQKVLNTDEMKNSLQFIDEATLTVEDLLVEAQYHKYDLATGPLVQLKVIQLGEQHYEMILGIHHIISDAWSLQVMQQELGAIYNALQTGGNIELPELRIQYKDYAAWQNNLLPQVHQQYWLQQLAGAVTPELPADRLRSAKRSFNGHAVIHSLNEELLQSLQVVSAAQQCSLYTVLVAAVHLLIFRYTGEKDIITGIPSAGREQEELESQLGYYINTLAIRNKVEAGESIKEFLSTVKKTLLDAYAHQSYPFDMLVDDLGINNNQSRNPLFDVMVNYEHRSSRLDEITVKEQDVVSRFDLSIHFTRYTNGITVAFTYNTDLFNKQRILRMAGHLQNVLLAIGNNIHCTAGELEVMGEQERDVIVNTFNDTARDYGEAKTIQELFENQVTVTPGALAVQFGNKTLTYEELNRRANRLAHYLCGQYNIRAGDCAGIMMERSQSMIVALLAILKAGAAYVPIDPAYPVQRRRHMIEDSSVKLLISDGDKNDLIDFEVLQWDELLWQDCPEENPVNHNTPDDIVYIIYTSGSTGKPKGVLIRHRSLFNLCNWLKELLYHKRPMVVMVTASFSFDASVKQLFPPLVSGGALHIITEEERTSPVKYLKALREGKTNVTDVTPSFLQLLLQTIKENVSQNPVDLQFVLAGGEVLQRETVRLFYELLPQAKLINVYGPTEACVDASFKVIDDGDDITIGKPLPNVQLFVADELMQSMPVGVFGELLIGGAGLAAGYNNQPELTNQKFIQHAEFGRLYRTGDQARWTESGEIEFSGRKDGQIKIRGYRIEIAEIESVVLSMEGVRDAAVVTAGQMLTAFVAWNNTELSHELQTHLQAHLPVYMVPDTINAIDELPKAPGGKVDRKALQQIAISVATANDNYVAATNNNEAVLVEIWQTLLQQTPVGIDDDFWQRGGHSLKAMRMMAMIYARLKIDLTIRDILEARTIRNLAEFISRQSQQEQDIIPNVNADDGLYPLSHAQKRLWIIDQAEEDLTAYNIVHSYHIDAVIEQKPLAKAVNYMAARHEILRTEFAESNGEVMQKVLKEHEFHAAIEYYTILAGEDGQSFIAAIVERENKRVFNLGDAPLFTITVISIINGATMVLNMHHIIADAWTVDIFKRELQEAYIAFSNEQEPGHPSLRYQYKDYAAWLNHKMISGGLNTSKDYWTSLLSGELPVLEMSEDFPRPLRKTYEGRQRTLVLQGELFENIKQQSAQFGCSSFTFLYAALNAFLYRYTGQNDIITGLPVAGRDRAELQDQLGFYVNVLPFRLRVAENISFELLLRQVQELLKEQLSHSFYPFDQIVEDIDCRKDLSRSPLFDILVNHQRHDVPAGDLSFSLQTDGESSFSKYDLTFDFIEFADAVVVGLSYNTALFLNDTAGRMVGLFEELLKSMLRYPQQHVHELNFIPAGEQAVLHNVFNNTSAIVKNKNVVELFEEQVAANGNATALIFENVSLTYIQLNEKINKLAHYLRLVHEVNPGDKVGVMLERSERMVIAMYAIIKSGAAYVPIDPAYPLQRRQYMAQDSEVKLLLTEEILSEIDFTDFANTNPSHVNAPADSVYMIYTSGSTGNPKGVVIQHAALANLCEWYGNFLGSLNQQPLRVFLNASINFDVSVGQLFGALTSGSTLVLSSEETKTDPHRLLQFLNDRQVDVIDITPSFLHILLLHIKETGFQSSVKFVFAAGEILPVETCNLFAEVLGENGRLFNLYGPTEACVYATMEEISLPVSVYNSIGTPLLNTRVLILNINLKEVPIGVWGEMFIGGAGLAAGYWKREELTNEKFIQHPAFGRLYRTGDVGRWTAKGVIEFKGRNDQQVKVRGFRVEPGEVERAIQSFPGVREAVVVYYEQLIAFVVGDSEALNQFLRDRLPSYMVPSQIIALDELPRTGSGKIDRVALKQQAAQLRSSVAYKAPASITENRLLQIWQQALNAGSIGVEDDFFELGGHSLKAMRMTSSIYTTFGVKVSLRDVFTNNTIQKLAKFIEAQSGEEYQAIEPVAPAECYLLSAGQQSIWFASQQGASSAYNMIMRYPWQGVFRIEAYQKAWKQLLERHEILRTVYVVKEGEVRQSVKSIIDTDADIEYDDFRHHNATEQDRLLRDIEIEQQQHVFDLANGPVIRTSVVSLSENQLEVFITIHHIACDAWSLKIIARDLRELYQAIIANRQPQLPALPVQYKDFAAWQNSAHQQEHKQYWNNVLEGMPVAELSMDNARPPVKSYAGHTITRIIDKEQLLQLDEICRNRHCSLFTLLTACVNFLLYRYTSQNDLVVGIPVAGRERNELQDGAGYYVNMLPLRTRFDEGCSFEELLETVHATLLEAYAHQSYPLETSLLNIVLNYEAVEANNQSKESEYDSMSKFDISIHFTHYSDAIALSLTYCTGLFSAERMRRMVGHLQNVLAIVSKSLSLSINLVQYISGEEASLVTSVFNNTSLLYEKDKTIHKLFETQAANHPLQTAVSFDGYTLSYGELNEEANRLAHYLRGQYDIGKNDRIGLMMDRSPQLVIALLAIIKSGAAYVPIDPAYPASRCAFMQQDSGMKVLISQNEYGVWSDVPVVQFKQRAWKNCNAHNPMQVNDAGDLVYIIYTSGSTGQPKGVRITHRSLNSLCAWHVQAFGVNNQSCGTLYAGIGFDASAWELWPYLVAGAAVYPVSDTLRFNLQSLAAWLQTNHISHCFLPTPACEEIIRSNIQMPAAMHLLTGGDRLRSLPTQPLKLYNNYGPTESTVVATSTRLSPENIKAGIPIGKPIGNTKIYILDKFLQAVPVGIYGEMYIAGDGLAQGYHNNDALTAERFIQHPVNNERLFKTGDFACWLADGAISFLGRIDNQVKVRGYRVELSEIENAIAKVSGVSSARVIADKSGDEVKLYGFYESDRELTQMHAELHRLLPSYMVPAVCTCIAKFPLTPNGKVDDKALLEIAKTHHTQEDGDPALASNEQLLASIWQQVLQTPVLRSTANFFELGGHSMKAMQLIHKVEKQLGYSLSLRDIYNNASLVAMAALLGKERQAGCSIILNHANASLPVLYMIPPIAGSATIYSILAGNLSNSFRCIGLQYPGFDGEQPFANSIAQTADHFAKEIMDAAEKHVVLLGYSLGALVAFETAKLLEPLPVKVTLILLDRDPIGTSSGEKISAEIEKVVVEKEIENWLEQSNIQLTEPMRALVYQNFRNLRAYKQYGSIKANILAFQAAHGHQQMNNWRKFTSGTFECIELPANHYNILSDQLLLQHLQNHK
jgi:tyrocidine synthetase III